MNIKIGPFALRYFSNDNWSSFEAAIVTNANGGMARRETALRASFKSEHLLDALGKDNPADTFTCPESGTIYYGKIHQTPAGTYVISAREVYTRALYERACKEGLAQAEAATIQIAAA